MQGDVGALNEMVRRESAFVDGIVDEAKKVIVGQGAMIERLLIGMMTGGHVLLEGVPGLAKTLTVRTLAQTLTAKFQRIQFTPDLLPADLIGTMIYHQETGEFSTKLGPIFANLVLADEINRAPAKVQSALLEAMQEGQVTIGETTHKLDAPFLVMATQNPVEQEGTYPLPEAQVDRFMLMVRVGYPTREEELLILDRMTGLSLPEAAPVSGVDQILRAREVIEQIYLDDRIKQYIVNLVIATRDPAAFGAGALSDLIQYGASPRATIFLAKAARAHAFLRHRGYVIPEDVKAIGLDVLRHRVIPTYEAEAEDLTSEDLVRRLFELVEVP
ncbi:MAG: ATPase [Deltaproteobacteria bacterium]|nr:ATPase [Deltaproteobacteria bacterium]